MADDISSKIRDISAKIIETEDILLKATGDDGRAQQNAEVIEMQPQVQDNDIEVAEEESTVKVEGNLEIGQEEDHEISTSQNTQEITNEKIADDKDEAKSMTDQSKEQDLIKDIENEISDAISPSSEQAESTSDVVREIGELLIDEGSDIFEENLPDQPDNNSESEEIDPVEIIPEEKDNNKVEEENVVELINTESEEKSSSTVDNTVIEMPTDNDKATNSKSNDNVTQIRELHQIQQEDSINKEQVTRKGNKHLIFSLKDELYGMQLTAVKEIIGLTEITPVPQVASYFLGLINLRGQIISIIDLRVKLGLPKSEYIPKKTSIIIMEINTILIGAVVDDVVEVTDIAEKSIDQNLEVTGQLSKKYINGVAKGKDGKLVILLNVANTLTPDELKQLRSK